MNYFGQNFMKLLEVPLFSNLILILHHLCILRYPYIRTVFYARRNREVKDKKTRICYKNNGGAWAA